MKIYSITTNDKNNLVLTTWSNSIGALMHNMESYDDPSQLPPIEVYIHRRSSDRKCDFVFFAYHRRLRCNERALQALVKHPKPIKFKYHRLLLNPTGETYFYLEITNDINPIIPKGNDPFETDFNPEFDPNKLDGELIFTIPQNSYLYCTDEFKQFIEAEGLTGLEFELVRDFEQG